MPAEQRALTSGALFEDGEVRVIGDEPRNTALLHGSVIWRRGVEGIGGWARS